MNLPKALAAPALAALMVAIAAPAFAADTPATTAPGPHHRAAGKGDRHPRITAGRRHLEAAIAVLSKATTDLQGHRSRAIELAKQAIQELDAGLAADKPAK